MTRTGIEFPFERARPYRIRELRAFEAELLVARQRDSELDRALRHPRGRASAWIRLRNKELVPLKLFADHTCLPDDDQFLLSPEGDLVDAQIVTGTRTVKLQFTLAAPIWGAGHGAQRNSGYQHHQTMVALNENECVIGHPPFTSKNGIATGAVTVISGEDRHNACHRGLTSAIANKASYDGRGYTLAVFAQDFYFQLLQATVFQALVDTVLRQHRLHFDSVSVFDSQPGFFVERHGSRQ